MSTLQLTRFRQRLDEALAEARRRGTLTARDYEGLLVDPDFDDEAFERFRAAAAEGGVSLPEDEPETLEARTRVGAWEGERRGECRLVPRMGRDAWPQEPHTTE